MDFEYEAPDGCHYESRQSYVWTGVMKFCGCYSDSLFNLFFDILAKLYRAKLEGGSYFYEYKNKTEAETDLQELILHALDAHDFAEHGTSVRGCWLTDKGVELCKLVWPDGPPSAQRAKEQE